MQLPKSTSDGLPFHNSASLDRIDSSLGYEEGNVQFICRFINLGKSSLSNTETITFIAQIAGAA
jgi:hypothetical protein